MIVVCVDDWSAGERGRSRSAKRDRECQRSAGMMSRPGVRQSIEEGPFSGKRRSRGSRKRRPVSRVVLRRPGPLTPIASPFIVDAPLMKPPRVLYPPPPPTTATNAPTMRPRLAPLSFPPRLLLHQFSPHLLLNENLCSQAFGACARTRQPSAFAAIRRVLHCDKQLLLLSVNFSAVCNKTMTATAADSF